ncbi:hypothetical protein RSOLAG22IIIB_00346 [Rhizoctonia solani]|uniref:Uncharacterized protein n=1 Tax=Rhizoctonia solani TaxID=456999 RepID=A0A0K6FL04_9AGAM|nr:hypothetical protein RSOLAG22IIIB_00346 [Rhizoctonia solani]
MCWPGYGFYCYSCCPLAHEHSSNLRPSPGQHDTVASEVTDLVECMNPRCIFSPNHSSNCRECSRTCIQEVTFE